MKEDLTYKKVIDLILLTNLQLVNSLKDEKAPHSEIKNYKTRLDNLVEVALCIKNLNN